jgi:Rieske 2Fe-2S family protein
VGGLARLGWDDAQVASLGVHRMGDWYNSAEVLRAEQRSLFSKSWALVGSSEELAEPGDYMAAAIGNAPVAIVRGPGGDLRAFHNVCRHRGMTLLEGTGRLGRFITCPYHQWSFDREGSLVQVPQSESQFEGMDPEAWGLLPAAVSEWRGMVFANPDPDAPTLIEAMAGLDGELASFLSGPLLQVACVHYEADCNWKLLIENHVDVYHLWYLHSRSLNRYAHRSFEWTPYGDNWWSMEPLRDRTDAPAGLPWLTQRDREGIGAHLLFPNLMMVTTGDYFATYDAVPVSPSRTRLTLRVRAPDGTDADRLIAAIRSFLSEDIEACRRLQQASSSVAFDYGPMASSHEAPVRRFHAALHRSLFPADPPRCLETI